MKTEFHGEARLENLRSFRDFVEEACRKAGGDAACFDLKLAVDEACTNIVMHGYAGRDPGPITLSFERDQERLTVEIFDRGRPFDPKDIRSPDLEEGWQSRSGGGLGWHLILSAVDEVVYEPDATNGNRLRLVKRVSAATNR